MSAARVVILCGGRGTRLQEHTQSIPKPMVEIGGRPILWHVIQIYLAQGFRRFLLLTGYLGEQVRAVRRRRAVARPTSRSAAWTPATTPPPAVGCTGPPRRWATAASASPTPTGSPTSTSTRCCATTPRTARPRR